MGSIKLTDMLSEANINPTITFLIGPPASGKSTWTSKNGNGAVIISRDDLVDKLRSGTGMSYSDTFKDSSFQSRVNSELKSHIASVLQSGKNIIVDMTNMSKNGRHNILSKVPTSYTKNAVVFNVKRSELIKRLADREKQTGKKVGIHIVDSMISSYQAPDKNEFDNIEYIQ